MDVSLVAGGSGVVILLDVFVRAMFRAARTAALALSAAGRRILRSRSVRRTGVRTFVLGNPDFAMCGWSSSEIDENYAGSATWDASLVDPCCCLN